MDKEKEYLSYTISKFDEVISDSELKMNNLREIYKFDYDTYLEERTKLEHKIDKIKNLKSKPYFARIDFKSNDNNEKCYIGKIGLSDYDNNIITVDWRAPIASLYYDSNIGECSYQAPDGIIKGNLLLKRQYNIENSTLIGFNDVDTVSNDEILKPYLNVNADIRLKNIVSTIQAEQNKIIRENISKNLIVQGVAGSGKTTVALHRIAFLVYNHRDLYKPIDYMIIGPNKFFVKYISSILPDLDVDGVSEYTFEELLMDYLETNYNVSNLLDVIEPNSDEYSYKVSMDMKNNIDEYFKNLEILPTTDFKIDGYTIVSIGKIKELYELVNKKIFVSIKSQIEHLILLLDKYIKDNLNNIVTDLIKKETSKTIIDDIKNNYISYLRKYFKVLNVKELSIYNEVLNKLKFKPIKQLNIDVSDIPALLYIKYLLIGNEKWLHYKHIVIDEAQDYGVFTFYVLEKLFKNATFSIYGDLAQSLYSYRSIKNWNEIESIFNDTEILRLNKSYRTTIEIMNEANIINRKLNLDEAVPVIRHGEEVLYTNKDLVSLINDLNVNYMSIAVITKTQQKANQIYEILKDKININLIDKNNQDYDNSINVLPSYLSKGLEFDAVIVINEFNETVNDLKLLYVSMTRALHKLIVGENIC